AVLRSFHFEGIFFVEVAQLAQFFVAEEAVVVESHLGVKRDKASIAGDDGRIDFEHGGVGVHKSAMQSLKKWAGFHGDIAGKAEAEDELARLIRLQTDRGMNGFAHDGFRMRFRDFFYVHPAGGTSHEDHFADAAIDENAEIKLALDVQTLFDENTLYSAAAGAGLRGNKIHTEHVRSDLRGLVGRMRELDAARFTAAAGVNL